MILSGLLLGLWSAGELKRREAILLDLKQMIQTFRTGISYSARPLAELVESGRDSRFCRLAAEDPSLFQDPRGALRSAGKRLLTCPEDADLYEGLIRGLGESDTQGQLEHLNLYGALLEDNLSRAKAEKEKKSRLYVCLGLFGGITLCLLLL